MSRPTHLSGIDDGPALAERHGGEPLCPEEFQAPAATPADAHALAREVQQKIAQARAASQRSPVPVAEPVEPATSSRRARSRRGMVPAIVAASLLASALAGAVWHHRKEVAEVLGRKGALDERIRTIGLSMQVESDPGKLAALDEQLTLLTARAEAELRELRRIDESEADEAEEAGDDLDRDLRGVLARLNARTYAVPPPFKQRLRWRVEALLRRADTREAYARKQKQWQLMIREFTAFGLPPEMAYVAWTASQFDPGAQGPSGARGLWQFTEDRAHELGLRVDRLVDERMDAVKETRAAARHLADLLSEFGDDSFMLAIASYDEANARAVRRVFHEVAQEPGAFRKDKRGFWRLYRLKKLPARTVEYLEDVLAAAIVGDDPGRYGLAHES